jgi:hypothetical protein
MENETTAKETKNWCESTCRHIPSRGCGGYAIYGLGFLGALVYYLTTATSLWEGFLGIIKAVLWPAFLVYGALNSVGM